MPDIGRCRAGAVFPKLCSRRYFLYQEDVYASMLDMLLKDQLKVSGFPSPQRHEK